jgi:hypothetical protein
MQKQTKPANPISTSKETPLLALRIVETRYRAAWTAFFTVHASACAAMKDGGGKRLCSRVIGVPPQGIPRCICVLLRGMVGAE